MTAMYDLAPRVAPKEGPGVSVRQLRQRLHGLTGQELREAQARAIVRWCLEKGTLRAEVVTAGGRPQYRLWRGPCAAGAA